MIKLKGEYLINHFTLLLAMQKTWCSHLLYLTCLGSIALLVQGHGRLWTPVNRSSAWRKGWDTPQNYNDLELFCGGFGVRYNN